MKMRNDGAKVWVFPDGDLPPAGDREPIGHESLVMVNLTGKPATARLTFYFEDRDPVRDVTVAIGAERVNCVRLDKPIGDFKVPFGQYALKVESDVPIVCQFGRLDVRQPNMAYYTTMGFPLS